MGQTALLPFRRKALKNPTASARFEPANLCTKGQHATSRPPKPLTELVKVTYCCCCCILCGVNAVRLGLKNCSWWCTMKETTLLNYMKNNVAWSRSNLGIKFGQNFCLYFIRKCVGTVRISSEIKNTS